MTLPRTMFFGVTVRWVCMALGAAAIAAACGAPEDDRKRRELDGEVGGGGFGGVPSGGAGGGQAEGGGATTTGPAGTVSSTTGAGGDCAIDGEPNDSEDTAYDLGKINDCDGDGKIAQGALDGPGDVDWFRYEGSDDFGCAVDPKRALAADGTLRFCKFVECLGGGGDVSCGDGSTPATSPNGKAGCCHDKGFGVNINCSGLSDDAVIVMRLDQAGAACVSYSVDFHY